MAHKCTQTKRFDEIDENFEAIKKEIKLINHDKPAAKTFLMIADVKADLDEHRTAQQLHEKKLDESMENIGKVLKIVEDKIIPAYEREVNAENAKKWIKEQAKSGSFWIGVLMSILGLFWALAAFAKQMWK